MTSKKSNVSINVSGGSVSIGGNANVGGFVEQQTVGSPIPRRDETNTAAQEIEPFDVFISYSQHDRGFAEYLSGLLESAGFSVWFDRSLETGQNYMAEIQARLDKAGAIIVLWSARSVNSEWVLNEAEIARSRGVLLPIIIDSGIEPPAPFRLRHARLLPRDHSAPDGMRALLTDVRNRCRK